MKNKYRSARYVAARLYYQVKEMCAKLPDGGNESNWADEVVSRLHIPQRTMDEARRDHGALAFGAFKLDVKSSQGRR